VQLRVDRSGGLITTRPRRWPDHTSRDSPEYAERENWGPAWKIHGKNGNGKRATEKRATEKRQRKKRQTESWAIGKIGNEK